MSDKSNIGVRIEVLHDPDRQNGLDEWGNRQSHIQLLYMLKMSVCFDRVSVSVALGNTKNYT